MTRKPRQVKPAKPGRPTAAAAPAPEAEASAEQAEERPDRTEGPTAETDARPASGEDDRAGETDIERARERREGSVETARQDPEDDVGGFVEPGSASSGRSD